MGPRRKAGQSVTHNKNSGDDQSFTPTLASEFKRGAVFGALAGVVVAAIGMGGFLIYASGSAIAHGNGSRVPSLLSGGITTLLVALPFVALISAAVGAVVTALFAFLGRHI